MTDQSPLDRLASESASQPALFSDFGDADGIAAASTAGNFSGEGLWRSDPGRYRSIVTALAEGMGIRQTARAFRVSPNTVAAIRQRERISIETEKTQLAALMRLGARLSVERIVEEIGEFRRESLPIVAGILVDKFQLLIGDATSIVERRDGAPAGTFAEVLQAARARAREGTILVEAEVVETGLGGRDAGQKGVGGSGLAGGGSGLEGGGSGLEGGGSGLEGGEGRIALGEGRPEWMAGDLKSLAGTNAGGRCAGAGNGSGNAGNDGARVNGCPPPPPQAPSEDGERNASEGGGGGRPTAKPVTKLPVGGRRSFGAKES